LFAITEPDSLKSARAHRTSRILFSPVLSVIIPVPILPVGSSKIGQSAHTKALKGLTDEEVLVGDEAAEKRSYLDLIYPVSNGVIRDWANMNHIWKYAFYKKMGIIPAECSILLTEPPMNPLSNREEMVRMMFEEYGFTRVHVATQAVLTLYSQGLTTGLVVDSGDGVTHIVPVYDGYVLEHLTKRLDIAGRTVTQNLRELIVSRRGYPIGKTPADLEVVRELKEKVCFVSPDYQKDRKLDDETTFHLTEVSVFTIDCNL
jgi:actin-related protein 2